MGEDSIEVLAEAGDGGDDEADERHLDVPHPYRGGGVLDHSLEVDAREAAGAAAAEDAEHAQDPALLAGEVGVLLLGEVDDGDADGQGDDRGPLHGGRLPPEHEHREDGGGDDLHLGEHLEEGCREVGRGDVLQVVLNHIETRGHSQTKKVSPAIHELVAKTDEGPRERGVAVDPQEEQEGPDEFDEFGEHDGCGGDVEGVGGRGDAGVSHGQGQPRVLQHQHQQHPVLDQRPTRDRHAAAASPDNLGGVRCAGSLAQDAWVPDAMCSDQTIARAALGGLLLATANDDGCGSRPSCG